MGLGVPRRAMRREKGAQEEAAMGVGEASDAPADGSAACRRMHYWGRVLGLENFPIPTSTPQETGWTLLQTTQDERTVSTEMPSSECGTTAGCHLSQALTLLGVEVVSFLPQLFSSPH